MRCSRWPLAQFLLAVRGTPTSRAAASMPDPRSLSSYRTVPTWRLCDEPRLPMRKVMKHPFVSEIVVDQLDVARLESDLLLLGPDGAHHVLASRQHPIGDLVVRVSGEPVTLRSTVIVTAPNCRQWAVGTLGANTLWAALIRDPFLAGIHL